MKKFLEEFKAFALKGNVMDMAVGVIIGGAFSGIVTSLTDNFINPLLVFLTGGTGYHLYSWAQISAYGSAFLSSVVNFLIMAFILFCLMKTINKALSLSKKPAAETPSTKICPFCKSEIPVDATKCAHCTSEQPE